MTKKQELAEGSQEKAKLEKELFDLEEQLGVPHKDRYYQLKLAEEREKEMWKAFGNFCEAIKKQFQ